MTKLTNLIAPALAASLALGAAVPALAAPAYGKSYAGGQELRNEIRQLDRRIDQALYRHQITRREAASLSARLDRLQLQLGRFARDGLTRWEVNAIDNQLDVFRSQLRREISDDRRYDRRRDDRDWSNGARR